MSSLPSPPGKITFGQQLQAVDVGGFIFTETSHPPGLVLLRHAHECANFNLTVRGGCRETVRGRSEECGPSCLVVKPPGEAHANRYGPAGARCLIVEVTPARLGALAVHGRLFDAPATLRRGPLVGVARRMYVELRARGCAFELVLEGLALEFVARLARLRGRDPGPAPPRWLLRARDSMHASFAEPIRLSALADTAGVDPSHFARTFRRWLGCSVGEYVRRLRLEDAAERLAGSEQPLAEIAVATGFYDQSHFTNAFKLHLGVTPAAYRRLTMRGASSGAKRSGRARTGSAART